MNQLKLQQAEQQFFEQYPGGFNDPALLAIGKKHKMEQMIALSQDAFKKSKFRDAEEIVEQMIKIVGRSSMVSMFEKPRFRDYLRSLNSTDKRKLSNGLKNLLHGDKALGFDAMLEVLQRGKLAKWSLITILPNYVHPDDEVFIKPTTVKGVIKFFELENLTYRPQPSWDFYVGYRNAVAQMKQQLSKHLSPNNAAFCGFLMMHMDN